MRSIWPILLPALLVSLAALAQAPTTAPPQPNPVVQPQPAAPPAQAPAATSSAPSTRIPTIHVTSRLVVLDVVVTDAHGQPAQGLQPSDFTILEDRVPQKLASFKEYAAAPASIASVPSPPNTFTVQPSVSEGTTKTVIVLLADRDFIRTDVTAFLNTAPANQAIALLRLDSLGMHLVQSLTSDRSLLIQAMAGKRMLPPVGFITHYIPAGPPAQELSHYVNSIPGRINLVFITSGMGSSNSPMQDTFPDISSVVDNVSGASSALHLSRVATYIIPVSETNVWANAAMIELAKAGGGHVYFCGIRQALTEIAHTGSDYYTLSYIPTNPNWNVAFRHIQVKVAGYPQPEQLPSSWADFWSQALGWTESQKSKVLNRPGYFARATATPFEEAVQVIQGLPQQPDPHHRLISYSPKGDPTSGAVVSPLARALHFGGFTPDTIHFSIVTTPSREIEKLKPGDPLPPDTYLTEPFRSGPFRIVRVRYQVDPHDLKLTATTPGNSADDLTFATVVYRDDGLAANSIVTNEHVQISAAQLQEAPQSGISFYQTIAVPVAGNPLPGNFYLRVAVSEKATGHTGAIELPAELIHLPPPPAVASAEPQTP